MPSATPELASLVLGAFGGLLLALTLYASLLQLRRARRVATYDQIAGYDGVDSMRADTDDDTIWRRLFLVLIGFFLVVALSLALSPIQPDLYLLAATFLGALLIVPQIVSLALPIPEGGPSRADEATTEGTASRKP